MKLLSANIIIYALENVYGENSLQCNFHLVAIEMNFERGQGNTQQPNDNIQSAVSRHNCAF